MNLTFCNVTADEGDTSMEEPLGIGITFHHLGMLLCVAFGGVAVALSLFLMYMHATHYSEPLEQRYILRILFMVPIYAAVSTMSFFFWRISVYLEVLRDCYEAFAISSFFALMCHYVAPTLHEQKERFRSVTPKRWVWPASWGKYEVFRTPRSGLTWFNVIWFCIFQYCVVRVACTILAVVTQAFGRYCVSSQSPLFAHVWVSVIEAIAVTIAMFCLIQFYVQLKDELAPYKPGMKLIAIKAVIFLSFWQTFILSFLMSENLHVIRAGDHVAQPDLTVGIPSLCICIEMSLFAVMHIYVYPWKPYDINSASGMQVANQTGAKRDKYYGGFMGVKAVLDAYNPMDILRAIGRGFRWFFVGRKSRFADSSYKNQGIGLDGTALEEGDKMGGLTGLKAGKQGKYSKLGGGEDADDAPLATHGADPAGAQRSGRSQNPFDDPSQEPRYPQDPFDDRQSEEAPHAPGIPTPFDDFEPPRRTPSRPYSPYEAYRAQRQSKHQQVRSMGNIETAPAPPTIPMPNHAHSASEGMFQPQPLHSGSNPYADAPSSSVAHNMQDNPWAYGKPL